MNKANFKIFILTVIFTCAVGASMAQKSEKEAIKLAESIDFTDFTIDSVAVKNVENPAFVILESNVMKFKGIITVKMTPTNSLDGRGYIINSGISVLYVPSSVRIPATSMFGEILILDSLSFTFEKGKCYIIDCKTEKTNEKNEFIKEVHKIDIFINESTDAKWKNEIEKSVTFVKEQIETRNSFLANPTRLDGTWNGTKNRLTNIFSMLYSIDGNKMKFEGKSQTTGKIFIAEGTVLYNENTIVFTPDKASVDGKEVKKFSNEKPYVWNYTLIDNELYLEGGRLFQKGSLIWENTGELHQTN